MITSTERAGVRRRVVTVSTIVDVPGAPVTYDLRSDNNVRPATVEITYSHANCEDWTWSARVNGTIADGRLAGKFGCVEISGWQASDEPQLAWIGTVAADHLDAVTADKPRPGDAVERWLGRWAAAPCRVLGFNQILGDYRARAAQGLSLDDADPVRR